MLKAKSLLKALKTAGFQLFTGTPCSYLTSLMDEVRNESDVIYVPTANEAEAIAIAVGAELGGMRSCALFQNSGLGNAINPLTSLAIPFQVPLLILTTWRGQPKSDDEPQHELMGKVTPETLSMMGIAWEEVPSLKKDFDPLLKKAVIHLDRKRAPFALLLPQGALESSQRAKVEAPADLAVLQEPVPSLEDPEAWDQDDVLSVIQGNTREGDVLIASTGYVGRALYALEDRPNQLYVVGSMGCAAALGLGLARAKPNMRIVVIDGDGSLLMHLGTLATLGAQKPENLVHVLLDNGVNDSTGGQPSLSSSVDFASVAKACGYARVLRVPDLEELEIELQEAEPGLTFLEVRTAPRTSFDLPRPELQPHEVAERLRTWLKG